MLIQKENLKSKPKHIGLKKAYFLVHPNSCLDFFLQNVHLITNIYSLKKLAEIQGGGGAKWPPLSLFRLAKGPAFEGLMRKEN